MADSSFVQTNFLGGEWSPYAQGRMEKETYRTALNLCYNSFPVEEGAWTRRPATLFAATTRGGVQACLRNFDFNQAQPYTLEFTAGHMRMFSGLSLVLELPAPVASISTADPAVVATTKAHGYSSGDQVVFRAALVTPGNPIAAQIAPLFNRQFVATVSDTTHFALTDPVTGASIDGSTIDTAGWSLTVARVVDFATAYTTTQIEANSLRVVQDMDLAIVCDGLNKPKVLQSVAGKTYLPTPALNSACFDTFNFIDANFTDGPYLDPPTDGSTLTPGGASSPVTLSASAITSINGGRGFQSTDVGRMIRLFSEPAAWDKSHAYAKGDNVKWQNAYWQALQTTTGAQPDTNAVAWAVTVAAAAWTWGTITTVNSTSQIVAALAATDPYGIAAGGVPLNGTQPIVTWRLGVYSDTTGWPTGGVYHEGRFWLFGAQFNRADATMSDNGGTPETQSLRFDPTALDGTVADDNGISIELQATEVNSIFWMIPDHQGLVMGTQAGEWLIQASNLNDPLTPFSVQAKKVTKYGCANIEPRRTGLSIAFVHRYQRKLMEYIADVYSGKFSGTNLAIDSEHLTLTGVEEIAYVQERAPIIWSRMGDGSLKGMTYKRESPFGTQPASFFGWHEHTLGSGRIVESIQAGPSPGGVTDALVMVTNDPSTNIRFVEMMSPVFDESSDITLANFVDGGVVPTAATVVGGNAVLYGLDYIAGDTVTAFLGGVDAGDYTVSATGTLTVPLNAANSLLTTARLQALSSGDYGYLDTVLQVQGEGSGFYSPIGTALTFTTSSSGGSHYDRGLFDWDKGLLYHEQAQHSGDPGTNGHSLFVFNLATRAQVAGPLDTGELALASSGGGGATGVTCMGYDGNIYYGTANSAHLVGRYNTTSFTNDIAYDDTHGLATPGYIAPISVGGIEFAVITSLDSGALGSSVDIVQMTGNGAPKWSGTTFTVDEAPGSIAPGNAFPCRGPGGGLNCFAWGSCIVIAIGPPLGVGATQLGIYQVTADSVGDVGMAKLGVITPAQVHSGWSTFTVGQPLYDETDGGILVEFANSGVNYLAKIAIPACTVTWTLLLGTNVEFHTSRVRGGRLSLLDGSSPYTLKQIDTLTGAETSGGMSTAIAPSLFSSDDLSGTLVVQVNDIGTINWETFGPAVGGGTLTPAVTYTAPCAIGFNYASRGQLLRRVDPQETGARNGPALGKTRRTHQAAFLLAQTQGLYVGSDFGTMQRPAPLTTYPGSTVSLPLTTLFTGICWTPIDDPYGFDGMLTFEVKRPYPATVTAIEAFLHTQDR